MKSKLVFFLLSLLIFVIGCASNEKNVPLLNLNLTCKNKVNLLVGDLITSRETARFSLGGQDPFGAGPLLSELINGYDNIKGCMSRAQKVEFFWVILWNLDFDGGDMHYLLKLANNEVGSDFIEKSNAYREILETDTRNKNRLSKIKAVIVVLEDLSTR